jgi:hypothetical protein
MTQWWNLAWCEAQYPHLRWTISGDPSRPVYWDNEYGWTRPRDCLPPSTAVEDASITKWRSLEWCKSQFPHLKWTVSGEPSRPVYWDAEYGWTRPVDCLPPENTAQKEMVG